MGLQSKLQTLSMWLDVAHPEQIVARRSDRIRRSYHGFCRATKRTISDSRVAAVKNIGVTNAEIEKIDPQKGYAIYSREKSLSREAAQEAKAIFDATDLTQVEEKYMATIPLDDLQDQSAIMRLATSPGMVKTVSDYLGMIPVLAKVRLFYSANKEWERPSSQFFHRDHDDVTQVKAILFVSDVSEDSGPFHLVPAAQSDIMAGQIRYIPKGPRVEDDAMEQVVGKPNILPIMGPAGTVALVDTSRCFHFGSRPGSSTRLAIFIQYLTPFAFRFPFYGSKNMQLPFARSFQSGDPEWKRLLLHSMS